ncbi:hypothetical protein [Massilia horti]|uniref:Uncharacterized protein n=1 Tax=Massilia horti TaxID=2562153 RepID=A0A4Y9SSS0_9BURK|nr:hypothetical protein [Massilia horti]TFW28264.1 hypothetical protein E4O92_21685 [Massilia horti]
MQIDRVPPLVQSVVQVRNWVVEHVPCTDSMLGYDLFLKLGNDLASGHDLPFDTLAGGLPYPPDQVLAHVRRMAEADLVELDDSTAVRPTGRFVALLDQYGREFESRFIVRQNLRSEQLLVAASDPELAAFAQSLYDRVYDMGWLYLHNFGAVCFLMASLVARLAEAHGHTARVASCYVEITRDKLRYLLGGQGLASPGQIDGHAACIIDEAVIVDFGLGNVRRGYRRDFHWGVVCDYRREEHVLGGLAVPGGERVMWKDDWQSPHSEAELARYAPHLPGLLDQYLARFG